MVIKVGDNMGLFSKRNTVPTVVKYKLITESGNGFYSYNGNLYQSDVVRACIRPFAQTLGKLTPKHIRNGVPVDEPYMRMLLAEPNPLMTGQMMIEKLGTILCLNHNSFAFIGRDENDYATSIYPISAFAVEAIFQNGRLYLKFDLVNGKTLTASYDDIIHLRLDYCGNDVFGENSAKVLTPLMEIVTTMDQGVVKAIKNSAVIRWILKFKQQLRPEDIKKQQKEFVESYMAVDSENAIGAAAIDTRADIEQVEPKDFVPNALQTDRIMERIYNYFHTNKKIIQACYTEDEWNAYYELVIEPIALQLSNEFTRKLFTRRERGFGNKIVFDAALLQYASMQTKLGLVAMVDRGALLPNEWRQVFNLGPVEGGDKPLRRLDTTTVNETNDTKEETDDGEED